MSMNWSLQIVAGSNLKVGEAVVESTDPHPAGSGRIRVYE